MRGLGKYTIPIIGVLSSGKSTFINGLFLNNSILEVGMGHTTKFICIIRHDENARVPQIYETSIQKRDNDAFNFKEKGEQKTLINIIFTNKTTVVHWRYQECFDRACFLSFWKQTFLIGSEGSYYQVKI